MTTSTELTGGAGFAFEDGVAAFYLASILSEGDLLGLPETAVRSVRLQRGGQGHPLDDLTVEGWQRRGETVHLDLQVTTTLRLTANDDKFADIVGRAWETVTAAGFHKGLDRVGGLVRTVGEQPLHDFRFLCDAARFSVDHGDFEARAGSFSQGKRAILDAVRDLIGRPVGGKASMADTWHLLRHFVLLRLDVIGDTASQAHDATERLRGCLTSDDPDRAHELWMRLLHIVQRAKATAGSIDRPALENELRMSFELAPERSLRADLDQMTAETCLALASIHDTIGGVRLSRDNLRERVQTAVGKARLVHLIGHPGSGKSVLLKEVGQALAEQGPLLVLKADRLVDGGWPGFRSRHQLRARTPTEFLRAMSLSRNPVLLIDGIDRVQPSHRPVVTDILDALLGDKVGVDWSVVTTVRTGAIADLRNWLSIERFETIEEVEVEPLGDVEAEVLVQARPDLRGLLFGEEPMREVARRPFFLSVLAGLVGGEAGPLRREVDLARAWWARGGHDAEGASRRDRHAVLLELARRGARTLGRGMRPRDLSTEAVEALVRDDVLAETDDGLRIGFAHDIFFEWAFYHALADADENWRSLLRDAGEPPALGRPVELLSSRRLTDRGRWADELKALEDGGVRSQWLRCWLLGPFQTHLDGPDRDFLAEICLAGEAQRLERVLTWFRATRTRANPVVLALPASSPDEMYTNLEAADSVPWPADLGVWARLCAWLMAIADRLPPGLWMDTAMAFDVWQSACRDVRNSISGDLIEVSRGWVHALEDHFFPSRRDGFPGQYPGLGWKEEKQILLRLRRLILASAVAYPNSARDYLQRLIERKAALEAALDDIVLCAPRLALSCPEALVNTTLAHLLEPLPKTVRDRQRAEHAARLRAARRQPLGSRERALMIPTLGPVDSSWREWDRLSLNSSREMFYPASPDREPFRSLFSYAPDEALRLVRSIASHTTASWLELHELNVERNGTPVPLDLDFPWGRERFYGGAREYSLFRGTFPPNALSTALMALEAWGLQQLDDGRDIDDLLEEVLRGQSHVAILGIAVSWLLYRPSASEAGLPVATCQRLWAADIARLVHVDMTNLWSNEIGGAQLAKDLAVALRRLNDRPHRRQDIRTLALVYMLGLNEALRGRFSSAVAAFPDELPFTLEEERAHAGLTERLRRSAEAWATMARLEDYRVGPTEDGTRIQVAAPAVDTPEARDAQAQMERSNREYGLFLWAEKTLDGKEIPAGLPTASQALVIAKEVDADLASVGEESLEDIRAGGVTGMAAVVLRDPQAHEPGDIEWAVDLLERTLVRPWPDVDPDIPNAVILWHPLRMAAAGLAGLAIRGDGQEDWAKRHLLILLTHPLKAVSQAAFAAALKVGGTDPRFSAIALSLRLDLCIRDDPVWPRLEDEERRVLRRHRIVEAREKAETELVDPSRAVTLPELPPAWARIETPDGEEARELHWREPDRWLELGDLHEDLIMIESAEWLADERRGPLLEASSRLLRRIIDRCAPESEDRHNRPGNQDGLMMRWQFTRWIGALCSHLPAATARPAFLDPVLAVPGEPGLDLVSHFAEGLALAGVHDARDVKQDTLDMLASCADRLASWRMPYRSDYLERDVTELVRTLLMVSIEGAGGAARFGNGDYRDVALIEPIVSRVLQYAGAHPTTVGFWLDLVERARDHYRFALFLEQAHGLLAKRPALAWRGTRIPGRLAGLVLHFVEREKAPDDLLRSALVLLDALIDEGDRRSAALQASEVFRSLERGSSAMAGALQ